MRFKNFAAMLVLPIIMLTACSKGDTTEMKEPAPADITSAIMAEIEIPSAVEKTKEDVGAY